VKILPLCVAFAVALAPALACDNTPEAESPQNPTPNPQYPAATAAATAPAAVAPTAAPTATTAPAVATATAAPQPTVAATGVTPAPTTTAAPTATAPTATFPTFSLPNFQLPTAAQLARVLPTIPLDPNLLAQIKQVGQQLMNTGILTLGDPADVGLKAASVRYAPLMLPEGAAYKDTLAAGAHKAFDVTLAGNKCYTIIAYSPPGAVSDVDLHLLVPPFYNMDAGHDDSASSTAVIGKAPAPICPFTLIPIPYRVDVWAKRGQGQVVVQVYSKNK
jgi:hypothetical protein